MKFLNPNPKAEKRTLSELVEAIQPYFDKGWENYEDEILKELSFTATNYCFANDFVTGEVSKEGWPKLYGAQSFLCYEGKTFFVRFNLWFPKKDSPVADQIKKYFSIGLLHNHNFPLFTVGLFGPGYTTGLYRWDDVNYDLKPGDKIDLKFTKDLTLSLGSALYIERDSDYHVQYWPEAFSISLNVIPTTKKDYSACQYLLNDDQTVREVLYTGNLPEGVGSPRSKKGFA